MKHSMLTGIPPPGSPDSFYFQLSSEGCKTWHTLSMADMRVLVASLKLDSAATQPQRRKANMTDIDPFDGEADPAVGDTSEDPIDVNKAATGPSKGPPSTSPAHSAPQSKSNDRHPRDVRRMMSPSKGKHEGHTVTFSTPSTVTANTHAFAKLDDDIESQLQAYWAPSSSASKPDFRKGD